MAVEVNENDVEVVIDSPSVTVEIDGNRTTVVSAGAQGPAGSPGLLWRGEWDEDATYVKKDVVFYNGSAWTTDEAVTVGLAPPARAVDDAVPPWELVARGNDVLITVSVDEPDNPQLHDIWIPI